MKINCILFVLLLTSCYSLAQEAAAKVPVATKLPAAANFYQSASRNIYFINVDLKFTWYEAFIECTFRGLTLLTVESDEKFKEILELLRSDKFGKKASNIWIGAIGSDRRFSWVSTGNPLVFNANHWLVNNPDNSKNVENCIQIYGDLAHLNDRNCNDSLGYVCEERRGSVNAESASKYKQFVLNFASRK